MTVVVAAVHHWGGPTFVPLKFNACPMMISGDDLVELSKDFDVAIMHTRDGEPYLMLDFVGGRFRQR